MTPRALVAVALAAVLALGSCGDSGSGDSTASSSTASTSTTTSATPGSDASTTTTSAPSPGVSITVDVVDGVVATASDRVEVGLGETVEIVVTSDMDEEVHVHGYDLTADVTPEQPANIEFTADIPGVFDVELEHSGVLITRLEVR